MHAPSSPSYRTFCSAPRARSIGPPNHLASPHVPAPTQSSYATPTHSRQPCTLLQITSPLTSTIFVSSNSCCTFIIASAWRGSWYFCTYVASSGKEMPAGFEKDDCGTLAVKSSRIFARRENAGRTGYSWSAMTTAAAAR